MKNNRKKLILMGVVSSLVLLFVVFFFLRKGPAPIQTVSEVAKANSHLEQKEANHPSVPPTDPKKENRAVAVQALTIPKTVEELKQNRDTNPLFGYPRFPLPGSEFEWVPKVRAVYGATTGEKLVTQMGGITYIESDRGPATSRVLFSPKENQFGVWTGELTVRSSPEALAQLLLKFDLRLQEAESSENNENELRFLKAGDNFSLPRDLSSMKQINGVQEVSIDVQFSRNAR